MSCNVAQRNAVVPGDVRAGLERCALCKLMLWQEVDGVSTNERTNMELLRAHTQYHIGRLRDAGAARWPLQGLI